MSVVNRLSWEEPEDGIDWELRGSRLTAARVDVGGAGASAGVRTGDGLVSVDGARPDTPVFVDIVLFGREVGERLEYVLDRGGEQVHVFVSLRGVAPENDLYLYLSFVGLGFLVVGVFALLRQPDVGSLRLFFLAAALFCLLALSPTSRLSDPWFNSIFWGDQLARNLVPGLFLYFSLTFPRLKPVYREYHNLLLLAAFGPAVPLTFVQIGLARGSWPFRALSLAGQDRVFQLTSLVGLVYMGLAVVLAILALAHSYTQATAPDERKRLKWLVGGTGLGLMPLVAFYMPLKLMGLETWSVTALTVLPLILVPLSFAYAAVGFRLWDVEIILKRRLIHALSILGVLAIYLASEWGLSRTFGGLDADVRRVGSLVATLLVAILFSPLRDRVQNLVDRFYYRERYRARRTLTDFARELNAENDLGSVVELLVKRVRDTLGVGQVAVLLRVHESDTLRIVAAGGELRSGQPLSSTFSQFVCGALSRREFVYVDDLRGLLDEYPQDREILESEDLAYFLPLEVKGDIIGVLALGRRLSGDYLSTEDLNVLQPLVAHAALAIDNALLYRESENKAVELERLKTYNENIVESITGGVMVLDSDGSVLSWNRSLVEIYGQPPKEVMGRQVEELFPSGFLAVLNAARAEVDQGLEPITSAYRISLRTRRGEDKVVTLSLAPLLGESGDTGTVIIVDDVTERTQLESRLQQAEKLTSVGLLAAGVAHEVNTPLTGISSYVQMLQRKMPETDPRRAILEKIEKQTFRASQIVNNLLNFSRQESGQQRPIDLNTVVLDTLALAEIQLKERRVRVDTELASDMRPVIDDPIKLQQALMNLVLNARDAMPQGGEVRIVTAQRDGDAVLEVIDNGSGIDAEHVHKVYDPFFTTKGVGKGTGLGLSVSYGIVQEHRGSINVHSEPGVGTRFVIELPTSELIDTEAARAS